jgi:NDP-sugar pyrophosphorylase family protein
MSPDVSRPVGAVLPVGGRGRRLREITEAGVQGDDTLKPLQIVAGRELIRYTLDLLDPKQIPDVVFAVDYRADKLMDWVDLAQLPHRIHFSTQTRRGVLEAVYQGGQQVPQDVFVYANTDTIRDGLDLKEALGAHRHSGKLATMVSAYRDNLNSELLLTVRDDKTVIHTELYPERYTQRPDEKGFVNTGLIIMEKAALEHFDLSRPDDMQGVIEPLTEAGQLAAYIDPHVVYIGVNDPIQYLEAERYFDSLRQSHIAGTNLII